VHLLHLVLHLVHFDEHPLHFAVVVLSQVENLGLELFNLAILLLLPLNEDD